MSRRWIGYFIWLALAGGLYFFENNTGTRIILCCSLLLPLIPALRRALFSTDKAASIAARPVTVRTFSYPEEEDGGGVRLYQPGDPVNRMHWKLSAKRNELLIRIPARETVPAETEAEAPAIAEGTNARRRKKRLLLCLAVILASLLCLTAIPPMRRSAQAVCNRLFEWSEQKNAYVYDRFPIAADQSAVPALALLTLLTAALLGITLLSGSRLLALGLMAGWAAVQMYLGLSLPGFVNVGLFAAFALWIMQRPRDRRRMLALLASVLMVSLAVLILYPGVDAATEAASERARDALAKMSQPAAGAARETPEGETETRHTHAQSLIQGENEARADREYRLATAEEEQISMPRWINYLKMILLLLAAVALVILPFLPFLWLNGRRKKALEARAAFASKNVSAAVCAVFRQVIAWLEAAGLGAGNLPFRDWAQRLPSSLPPGYAQRFSQCAALFEEAAYSDHPLSEAQRGQALALLEETERALLAKADWKQKLRFKYGECLWTEKA